MSTRIIILVAFCVAVECAVQNRLRLLSKTGVCPDETLFGDRKWVNLDKNLCEIDADCTGTLKCCKFYGSKRCLPDASQVKFNPKSSKMPMPENAGGKNTKNITACSDVCLFGTWNPYDICSDPQAHAIGFYAKMQPGQGNNDDTALNGIKFICGYQNGSSAGQEITSGVGQWGAWEPKTPHQCSSGAFITSFQLLYEPYCFTCDDTSADGLRVQCSDGNVMEDTWTFSDSKWSPWYTCPPNGYAVNGIQTQIEGPTGDDTAMNNMCIQCTPL